MVQKAAVGAARLPFYDKFNNLQNLYLTQGTSVTAGVAYKFLSF